MLEKAGRYHIIEELGHGAMGVVYRGFDATIGRTVAIKTILLDNGDPEQLIRFRQEAQAAGVLSHPGIVTIYDAGEDHGLFYIAMEHVQGETLQARMARGQLPFEEVLRIIEQVGAALDHAHARHVVHRDVKPANIMLTPDGTAKVMDFGVAKLSPSNMTTAGQILGTPSYLSPETVKGHPVDGRSDIFSLGVVLYEVLSGEKPFKGDSVTTVIYKILEKQPDAPTGFKERLLPGLEYVLNKALEKDPANRYQTCESLSSDLKNCRSPEFKYAFATAPTGTLFMDARDFQQPPQRFFTSPPEPAVPINTKALRSVRLGFILTLAGLMAVLGAATFWGLNRMFSVGKPAQPTTLAQPKLPESQLPATSIPEPAATPVAPEVPAATPPPPVAAKPNVDLIPFLVTSNIAEASVFVDGESRPEWVTPHRLTLKPGVHRIEVRKPGYKPESQSVLFAQGGPKNKNFELVALEAPPAETPVPANPQLPPVRAALNGRLQALTQPAGARILVDGSRTNYITPVNFQLSAGPHKITFEHRCCDPVVRDVIVQPDQIVPIREQLRSKR